MTAPKKQKFPETQKLIETDIKKRELTRQAYANLLNVTTDSVYKWLSGNYNAPIHIQMLIKLDTEILRSISVK
jgi:DNA-binding transcriptional regulator YiaG